MAGKYRRNPIKLDKLQLQAHASQNIYRVNLSPI